jgi:hypothetical protein
MRSHTITRNNNNTHDHTLANTKTHLVELSLHVSLLGSASSRLGVVGGAASFLLTHDR